MGQMITNRQVYSIVLLIYTQVGKEFFVLFFLWRGLGRMEDLVRN